MPILHEDLVRVGFATDGIFAASMAIGQVAPGPSGLWVVSLGYFVGGVPYAFLALLAVSIPPAIVLLVGRAYEKHAKHPAVEGFVTGLGFAVVAVFAVVMARFLGNAGLSGNVIGVAFGAFALTVSERVPVILIILAAAALGLAIR